MNAFIAATATHLLLRGRQRNSLQFGYFVEYWKKLEITFDSNHLNDIIHQNELLKLEEQLYEKTDTQEHRRHPYGRST